jgi:uncharacterized repeat protein (TIGR03803 family)
LAPSNSIQESSIVLPSRPHRLLNIRLGFALLLIVTCPVTSAWAQTLTAIASFNGTNGATPVGGVAFDANGDLFGTAAEGGAYGTSSGGYGTVWEIAHGSNTITALASFNFTDGSFPSGDVAFDANGNLFGAAPLGGANNAGTVWEIHAGSSTITTLASFNNANGNQPYGGVVFDSQGNLFGTTELGGANNAGTVWEIHAGGSTITTLDSLDGSNGHQPYGGVTLDSHGDLFGTSSSGGANNYGTVWEIHAGTSSITTLVSFDLSNGAFPLAGMILDAHGNLFGTAAYGGANDDGTVWEIANGSSTLTTLASFNGTNGISPQADMLLGPNGDLYGTTVGTSFAGGNNYGTVWVLQGASVPEPSSIVTGLIGLALASGFVLANRPLAQRNAQEVVRTGSAP